MCVNNVNVHVCGHHTSFIQGCPTTTQEANFPNCTFSATRVTHLDTVCPDCTVPEENAGTLVRYQVPGVLRIPDIARYYAEYRVEGANAVGFVCGHCAVVTFIAGQPAVERLCSFCVACARVIWNAAHTESIRRHTMLHERARCGCGERLTEYERARPVESGAMASGRLPAPGYSAADIAMRQDAMVATAVAIFANGFEITLAAMQAIWESIDTTIIQPHLVEVAAQAQRNCVRPRLRGLARDTNHRGNLAPRRRPRCTRASSTPFQVTAEDLRALEVFRGRLQQPYLGGDDYDARADFAYFGPQYFGEDNVQEDFDTLDEEDLRAMQSNTENDQGSMPIAEPETRVMLLHEPRAELEVDQENNVREVETPGFLPNIIETPLGAFGTDVNLNNLMTADESFESEDFDEGILMDAQEAQRTPVIDAAEDDPYARLGQQWDEDRGLWITCPPDCIDCALMRHMSNICCPHCVHCAAEREAHDNPDIRCTNECRFCEQSVQDASNSENNAEDGEAAHQHCSGDDNNGTTNDAADGVEEDSTGDLRAEDAEATGSAGENDNADEVNRAGEDALANDAGEDDAIDGDESDDESQEGSIAENSGDEDNSDEEKSDNEDSSDENSEVDSDNEDDWEDEDSDDELEADEHGEDSEDNIDSSDNASISSGSLPGYPASARPFGSFAVPFAMFGGMPLEPPGQGRPSLAAQANLVVGAEGQASGDIAASQTAEGSGPRRTAGYWATWTVGPDGRRVARDDSDAYGSAAAVAERQMTERPDTVATTSAPTPLYFNHVIAEPVLVRPASVPPREVPEWAGWIDPAATRSAATNEGHTTQTTQGPTGTRSMGRLTTVGDLADSNLPESSVEDNINSEHTEQLAAEDADTRRNYVGPPYTSG